MVKNISGGFHEMGWNEFYDLLKIGDQIPQIEKDAVMEGYKTPEVFGIELLADSEKAIEKAGELGVDSIHTSKVFGGVFMLQFISEMITNWLPSLRGWVEGGKLSAKFIKLVKFNERIICRGRIKDKIENGDGRYLVCDVWVENASGDKVVIGEAHIAF
jgi:hypothetical protein